ncbi:MAG: tetratricopeptide repeat protein [Holophagales bacterium]|nr:tetratricopeptide repeat protein [Holophagales bacterium]MYC10654.1 tetratricopeptide repeat protein [Holophagales bacterium]MYD24039.1 tetratricopeptide repeat protein [Holophagales bacterium]
MTSREPAIAVAVAAVLAAALALAPPASRAQPPLEPVERPRTDSYERPVQEQLRTTRETLDRLLEDPDADRLQLTAAFGQIGQLYLVYDFWRIARTALANAEKLDPTDARWPYYQAIANTYDGNDEAAVAALDRVLQLVPDDLAARTRRAYALLDLGGFEDAAEECRRILELDPSHSAAYLGLGRIEFEAGRFERAIEHFTRALDGQPEGSAIHHRIGLALRRLGRREEAADHLARNQQIPVSYADPLYSAMQALNVSRKAVFARGAEAMRTGNPELALVAFEAALRALPDDPETLFNVAMALVDLGDKPAAEARLREAIALDPDYREPRFNLALILAERNDFEGAERHFRRATEIDPDDLDSRTRWADTLTRLGRADEAIGVLDAVLAVDAALPAARLALGAAQQASDNLEAARTTLNGVLEAAPGAPQERSEAHYRLAVLLAAEAGASGSPAATEAGESAVSHLRAALELDAGFAEAHVLLGRLLGQQERYAEAAGHFARALVKNPSNPGWHRDRAMALLLARRYAAARGALTSARRALANSADDPVAAAEHLDTLLARLLAASPDSQIRNGREALAIAQRLMSDRPSIEHAETVAMALAEIGEFERAAELQRQLIAEVERQGASPTNGQRQRLESYLAGEPVREPWFSP